MIRIILFLILFFLILKKQTESFINPYNRDNYNKNYLDTETFFENMNTQPIIHDNDSIYDIYDKIDNTNKFSILKDIVCYSDSYCSPSPVLRTLDDLK